MRLHNTKNLPAIRFKNHTTHWKNNTLGHVFNFQYGNFNNNPSNRGPYPVFGANGIIGGYTEYNAEDSVVIGHMGEYAGSINWGGGKHFVTYNGTITTPKGTTVDSTFGFHLLDQLNIRKICGGSGQPFLSYDALERIATSYPGSPSEQKQIGSYFKSLDRMIGLHQRKHDKLLTLKQAMLQKMFPQDGATTPEIRFKGFKGEWKEELLGDLMPVGSVKRIHQSDWEKSGIRFLRARDVVSAFKNEDPADLLYISHEKYEEYSRQSGKVGSGDLLVTGVGTIGVPFLISNDDPIYFKDGNIIWFKNGGAINGTFFFYAFSSGRIQTYISESAGIGTVGTYTIDSGKKTPFIFPDSDEQKKIGTYFQNLDKLISKHATQLEKLKNIKSACLQKMFV